MDDAQDCNSGCVLQLSDEEVAYEANILRFVDAIAKDEDLEFMGVDGEEASTNAEPMIMEDDTKYGVDELFVLKDKRISDGTSGAFPKVEIKEVMEKCTSDERAKHIIGVLKGEENAIRLHGITRIVGYYSRTTSWNKSKIGELRDRGQGEYKLAGGETNSQERHTAINAL